MNHIGFNQICCHTVNNKGLIWTVMTYNQPYTVYRFKVHMKWIMFLVFFVTPAHKAQGFIVISYCVCVWTQTHIHRRVCLGRTYTHTDTHIPIPHTKPYTNIILCHRRGPVCVLIWLSTICLYLNDDFAEQHPWNPYAPSQPSNHPPYSYIILADLRL